MLPFFFKIQARRALPESRCSRQAPALAGLASRCLGACLLALGCMPLEELSAYSAGGSSAQETRADAGARPVGAEDAGQLAGGEEDTAASADAAAPPTPAAPSRPLPGEGSALPDLTPPRILASAPADGARGVRRDARLSVTFDEPMDRRSVEAAYRSDDLPPASVTFSWSADGRELSITPAAELAYAAGTDPSLAARAYFFAFASGASDIAGNALAPSSFAFTTLRQITQRSSAISDRDLTGNYRADGVYGSNGCERAQARICVGDSGVAVNVESRGFVSFGQLIPSELEELVGARLELTVESVLGAPFADLGVLSVEAARFSAIGPEAFAAPPASAALTVATVGGAGQILRADVLPLITVGAGAASQQFRLQFASSTDLDGSVDMLLLEWDEPLLELTYLAP